MKLPFKNTARKRILNLWVLLLLLSCFGTTNQSFAQSVPVNCEDDESVRLHGFNHFDTLPEFDNCTPKRHVVPVSIVRYQNYAKVTFAFDQSDLVQAQNSVPVYYKEAGSNLNPSVSITGIGMDNTARMNIPVGKDFKLITINTCDEVVEIGDFSTRFLESEIIPVDEILFDAVMDWTRNSQGKNLYELVASLNNVDVYSKTAFLQQYFKAQPLPSSFDGVLPPKSAFVPDVPMDPEKGECLCRTMKIAVTRNVSPRGPINAGFITPNSGNDVYNFTGNPSRGKISWDFSYAGPARYRNLDGETSRCRNSTESRRWGGLNPSTTSTDTLFPFIARMRFGQACADANWNPSDCSCTQEIRLSWQYDSKMFAQAFEKDGRWCFNMPGRSALAVVDDACIVTVARKNVVGEDDFKVVDAGRGAVVVECKRDFQEERLVDLVKLAANIYSLTKGKAITTGVPALDPAVKILWDMYHKDKILDNIESLITEPWMERDGKCGEDDNDVVLGKSRTELLKGNDEFMIVMSAATYMEVAGITHWKATARLKSGFHLTGVLLQNFVTPPNMYCCSRSYGSWIAKSMFGPSDGGNTTPVYQEFAGEFLNNAQANFAGVLPLDPFTGAYTISTEIGEAHGVSIPNCSTLINERDEDNIVSNQPTGAFIVTRGNELWYVNQTPVDKLSYRVFDVQGRLLLEGENSGNDILLGQLPTNTSGNIHLVHIQADGVSKTFKFLKP